MARAEFDGQPFRLDTFALRLGEPDVTKFSDAGWRSVLDALPSVQMTVSGRWEADDTPVEWTVPPHVPFRILLPSRRWKGWFPRWEVVEYSREPNRPLVRTAHRRWWWASYGVVRWWLLRRFGLDPKGSRDDAD